MFLSSLFCLSFLFLVSQHCKNNSEFLNQFSVLNKLVPVQQPNSESLRNLLWH